MTPELQLAEMYIRSELNNIGRARISYPTEEQIKKRKAELLEEVKKILGDDVELMV
jgi:hypothetical protein